MFGHTQDAKVLSFCSTKKLSAPFKCSGVGVNKRERVLTYTHTSSLRSGWRVRINHNCAAKTQICLHVAERVHINNPKCPQKSRGQRKTHRARWCTPSLLKPTKDGCISLTLSYAAEVYMTLFPAHNKMRFFSVSAYDNGGAVAAGPDVRYATAKSIAGRANL
jgi:hypothetical protein